MDNALYVGLSRQMTLQRALDVASNNIANMDTAGFKVEQLSVRTDPLTPTGTGTLGFGPVNYVLDNGVVRNFGQGELEQTNGSYDLAIEGDGMFSVQTANGVRYTRDGRFTLDSKGQIIDKQGDPVLSSGGSPISVDPSRGAPMIAKDGTVSQTGPSGQNVSVGKIGVVRFSDLSTLSKGGDNLFEETSGQSPQTATDVTVRQGMVEHSNVRPVSEITNLIQITRTYERVQNLMTGTQDLSSKAIDALGKLN